MQYYDENDYDEYNENEGYDENEYEDYDEDDSDLEEIIRKEFFEFLYQKLSAGCEFHGKPNPIKLGVYNRLKTLAVKLAANYEQINEVTFTEPCENLSFAAVEFGFTENSFTFVGDSMKIFKDIVRLADDIEFEDCSLEFCIDDTYTEDGEEGEKAE